MPRVINNPARANAIHVQPELFPLPVAKLFRGVNGRELRYWPSASGGFRVELSDRAIAEVSKEGPGQSGNCRLYARIPGEKGFQARSVRAVLAQLALIDQIRGLNKSIQIKLKQQDDAARLLSDLTKENDATELQEEIARLRNELEAAKQRAPGDAPPRRGQAINIRALQWALDQRGLPGPAHHVLLLFAIHSDKRGYTWPSVDRIAEISGQDEKTVRGRIEELLVRRRLCRTKKRSGSTGQVKVYRMPRSARKKPPPWARSPRARDA